MNKGCKGCYSWESNNVLEKIICTCNIKMMEGSCPCKTCLIKVMCMSGCEKYKEYKILMTEDRMFC